MPYRSSRAWSLLDSVRIATPCAARWEDMRGDERVRFCGRCRKNVYDLSEMTRAEAEMLLRSHAGELCVSILRRADGTVITSDCPVGVRARRVRRLAILAVGAGAAAVIAGDAIADPVAPATHPAEERGECLERGVDWGRVEASPPSQPEERPASHATHRPPCNCPYGDPLCLCL
jgi:hypothetical protein